MGEITWQVGDWVNYSAPSYLLLGQVVNDFRDGHYVVRLYERSGKQITVYRDWLAPAVPPPDAELALRVLAGTW